MQRSIGLEIAASAGIYSKATSGTTAAQLGNIACTQVILYNTTGTDLNVSYCDPDTGADLPGQTYLLVPDDIAQPLRGISNANQVKIVRADGGTSAATLHFVAEGVAVTP